ncbi:Trypsin-1 [Sarcoptes scabiei]|nr:Trypsin-1 [Sarcoptes scabiei]
MNRFVILFSIIVYCSDAFNLPDWSKFNPNSKEEQSVKGAPTRKPDPSCGLSLHSIDSDHFGPFDVPLGTVTWQVSIETKSKGRWKHSCGGVVIASQAVLTTASCVKKTNSGMVRSNAGIVTLLESNFVRRRRFTYPGAQKPNQAFTEAVKIHPEYNSKTLENNLAVLRLAMPFDFDEMKGNLDSICLSNSSYDGEESTKIFVSGWGAGLVENLSTKLQMSQARMVTCPSSLTIHPNEFCVSQYESEQIDSLDQINILPQSEEITTPSPVDSNHLCVGDMGGAIFTGNSMGPSKLIGLASRGSNCTDQNPLVFIAISDYYKWIMEVSKPYY